MSKINLSILGNDNYLDDIIEEKKSKRKQKRREMVKYRLLIMHPMTTYKGVPQILEERDYCTLREISDEIGVTIPTVKMWQELTRKKFPFILVKLGDPKYADIFENAEVPEPYHKDYKPPEVVDSSESDSSDETGDE